MDIPALKKWFFLHRRDLPWRKTPSPYQVWISEVMLQQTRVHAVIPFFSRFMERFPHVKDLAKAPIEEVIKVWEGLGYYSRARNLHEGAKYLVKWHGGEIPKTREELEKIKGIGSYTAGAILSFAYKKKATAIDANIARVMARFFGIEDKITLSKVQKTLETTLYDLLPEQEPWIALEALIELGALVCDKKPECMKCPLAEGCIAKKEQKVDILPLKETKRKATHLHRLVILVEHAGRFLVKKGEKGKVMADLYEFFYVESADFAEINEIEQIEEVKFHRFFSRKIKITSKILHPREKHSFTRFVSHLIPVHLEVETPFSLEGYEWITKKEMRKVPFSSGHKKLLQKIVFSEK